MAKLTRRQILQSSLAVATAPNFLNIMSQNNSPQPAPRIAAFEDLAFGIFLHYGLYSLEQRGEWTMHLHNTPRDEYMKHMANFDAKEFSGQNFAKLAKQAGAKYITLTSRHHDGFSLYDSHGLDQWDITKTPAGRDLIKDFTDGCRAEGIIPCLYHTTLDWSEPRFNSDWKGYQQYLRDSVDIITSNYGPLGAVWFDGNWSKRDADWELDALYSLVRKNQPNTLIINNTGIGEEGKLVHPEIDAVTFERGRPEPIDHSKQEKYFTGEMCHTANFHWGTAFHDYNMISPATVIEELCRSRAAGCNFLMNLGPLPSGAIPDYEAAMFKIVGRWVAKHGGDQNPIYKGRPSNIIGEDEDFGFDLEEKGTYLFAFDTTATADPRVSGTNARGSGPRTYSGINKKVTKATQIDTGQELKFEQQGDKVTIHTTDYPYGMNTVVRITHLT